MSPPSSAFDGFALPSGSRLLGWTLRDVDPATGTIEVGFTADTRFLNPAGTVQGGYLTAMLDDVMGPALFAHSEGRLYPPTITLTVAFLAPAPPGGFIGKGRVVSLGRTIVHLEGELFTGSGQLVARATATGRVVAADKATA